MPQESAGPSEAQDRSSQAPRRILITGATGMIGHALRAAATNQGWTAVPMQRPMQQGKGDVAADPTAILWDPGAARPFADPDRLEGFDAVVNLAGANLFAHRWTAAYKKTIADSRTQTTGALSLALARLQKRPDVLISASAIGFYGSRGDEVLTEESAAGQGFLSEVCRKWERATEAASAAGIRVVNVRFGVVLTPAGGALKQMLPLFRSGMGGRLGSGEEWMSWVALDDLLATIFHTIEHTDLHGPVNIVAPNPVRNAEFTKAMGETLKRPVIVPAPAFALRAAFGEMADESLLASCRAVPARLDASGFQFKYPTIGGALHALLSERVRA